MTYFKLNRRITIGNLFFDYVSKVEISKSWEQLTDTATITLPRKLKLKDEALLDSIEVGQKVLIQLGYSPNLHTEFKGYVARIKPTVPVEIECEDEMYQFKNSSHTASFKNANLSDVLNVILGGRKTDAVQVGLGPFQITSASGAKVLNKIKKDYGLVSWFDNQTLVVGKRYRSNPRTEKFQFQYNIIENDLEFRRKGDVKVKIVGVSEFLNGSTIKVQSPTDAEIKKQDDNSADYSKETRHFFEMPQADLKERVKDISEQFRYDGYRGEFTTFGEPFVMHGDRVDLKDDKYPERGGLYFIDAINVEFGENGYRRTIKLGPKAS